MSGDICFSISAGAVTRPSAAANDSKSTTMANVKWLITATIVVGRDDNGNGAKNRNGMVIPGG